MHWHILSGEGAYILTLSLQTFLYAQVDPSVKLSKLKQQTWKPARRSPKMALRLREHTTLIMQVRKTFNCNHCRIVSVNNVCVRLQHCNDCYFVLQLQKSLKKPRHSHNQTSGALVFFSMSYFLDSFHLKVKLLMKAKKIFLT